MYHKLLVPVDGTVASAAAVPLAQALAKPAHAEVALLQVVARPDAGTQHRRREEVAAELARLVHQFEAAGLRATSHMLPGEPAQEIVREAERWGADLVVMATHGRSGFERAMLGSVSQHVLVHSRVPVALVRPGGHRVEQLRTLLVPVDGTPGGALALNAAVGLVQPTGAKLVLLRAAVPLPLWIYEPTLGLNTGPLINPMWHETTRIEAERYVDDLVTRLRASGIQAEGRAVSGGAAESIVQGAEASKADLIVMSTHAHVGPVRAVLGSVADTVVRTAGRPVLLLRRGGAEPDDTGGEGALSQATPAPKHTT